MMDRELLELATKAIGVHWQDFTLTLFMGEEELREWPYDWNPLLNDGDALRLAVKLWMSVDINDRRDLTDVIWTGCTESVIELHADHGGDKYAATRRAIVRAAAEIGGAMS